MDNGECTRMHTRRHPKMPIMASRPSVNGLPPKMGRNEDWPGAFRNVTASRVEPRSPDGLMIKFTTHAAVIADHICTIHLNDVYILTNSLMSSLRRIWIPNST